MDHNIEVKSESSTVGLDHVITFGKHRGTTVRDLIKLDSNYLHWAYNSIEWFKLDNTVLDVLPPYIKRRRNKMCIIPLHMIDNPGEFATEEEWLEYNDLDSCFENY